MKALHWERTLRGLREKNGREFFRPTELANIAQTPAGFIAVEIARLAAAGVLVRYAHGVYGLPGARDIRQLVGAIDPGAYITGAAALHFHGLVSQEISNRSCFTNRRHNRSRVRVTPLGTFTFICVAPPVYSPPGESGYASPAQALCDFVYIMRRHGALPESVATMKIPGSVSEDDIRSVSLRYPRTVAAHVESILADPALRVKLAVA